MKDGSRNWQDQGISQKKLDIDSVGGENRGLLGMQTLLLGPSVVPPTPDPSLPLKI